MRRPDLWGQPAHWHCIPRAACGCLQRFAWLCLLVPIPATRAHARAMATFVHTANALPRAPCQCATHTHTLTHARKTQAGHSYRACVYFIGCLMLVVDVGVDGVVPTSNLSHSTFGQRLSRLVPSSNLPRPAHLTSSLTPNLPKPAPLTSSLAPNLSRPAPLTSSLAPNLPRPVSNNPTPNMPPGQRL